MTQDHLDLPAGHRYLPKLMTTRLSLVLSAYCWIIAACGSDPDSQDVNVGNASPSAAGDVMPSGVGTPAEPATGDPGAPAVGDSGASGIPSMGVMPAPTECLPLANCCDRLIEDLPEAEGFDAFLACSQTVADSVASACVDALAGYEMAGQCSPAGTSP